MTINPIQPTKGNRDEAPMRTDGAGAPQGQSSTNPTSKSAAPASGRDDGSRSFRSGSESPASSTSGDGASPEILRCLDGIQEYVGKLRTALGASSRGGTKEATDRQSNEGGWQSKGASSAAPSTDANRSQPSKM